MGPEQNKDHKWRNFSLTTIIKMEVSFRVLGREQGKTGAHFTPNIYYLFIGIFLTLMYVRFNQFID